MRTYYYFDSTNNIFHFGKHKGKTLANVLSTDFSYFKWCVNNIDDFDVSCDIKEQVLNDYPSFVFPVKCVDDEEEDCNEDYDSDYPYEDYGYEDMDQFNCDAAFEGEWELYNDWLNN